MKWSVPKLVLIIRVYSPTNKTAKTRFILSCVKSNEQLAHTFPACNHTPMNSRPSRLVSENLLNVCDISTLRSLQKVLLFPHVTWVSEKMRAFIHKSITKNRT